MKLLRQLRRDVELLVGIGAHGRLEAEALLDQIAAAPKFRGFFGHGQVDMPTFESRLYVVVFEEARSLVAMRPDQPADFVDVVMYSACVLPHLLLTGCSFPGADRSCPAEAFAFPSGDQVERLPITSAHEVLLRGITFSALASVADNVPFKPSTRKLPRVRRLW